MNSADKIRAEQIRSAKESRCQAGASGDLIARAKTLQSTFSGVRDDPLAHTWVTRYRSLIAAVKHLSPRVDPRPIETPRGDNGGHVRSAVALRANTRVWAKAWSPTQGPGNIWSFWSDLDQRPWINLQNLSKWMSYKYLKPVRGECVCVEPDGTTCIIFSGNTWILKQGPTPPNISEQQQIIQSFTSWPWGGNRLRWLSPESNTKTSPKDVRRQRCRKVTSSRWDKGDLCSARVNKHQS